MEINIRTEQVYGDELINSVEVVQDGESYEFTAGVFADEFLMVTESGEYESDLGTSYLPEGTLLNFEVMTPRPDISIEVSADECTSGDEGPEYNSWSFESSNQAENFIEQNNIKVVGE